MNSPLTPTQHADPGHGSSAHPLTRLAAYAFLAQGVIFVAVAALLPMNTEFFEPHGSIAWPEFLTELDAAPAQFLTIKALMLALRTLHGISIVGVAVAWWAKNRSAAVLVVSFIIVSIPVINISQLMGMALVPLADSYTVAASLGDSATMTSMETTASTTYLVAEFLDTFVNVVPFVGLLASLFWLSSKVDGLERIKWILPVLIVLPCNKLFDLPSVLQLGAACSTSSPPAPTSSSWAGSCSKPNPTTQLTGTSRNRTGNHVDVSDRCPHHCLAQGALDVSTSWLSPSAVARRRQQC